MVQHSKLGWVSQRHTAFGTTEYPADLLKPNSTSQMFDTHMPHKGKVLQVDEGQEQGQRPPRRERCQNRQYITHAFNAKCCGNHRHDGLAASTRELNGEGQGSNSIAQGDAQSLESISDKNIQPQLPKAGVQGGTRCFGLNQKHTKSSRVPIFFRKDRKFNNRMATESDHNANLTPRELILSSPSFCWESWDRGYTRDAE